MIDVAVVVVVGRADQHAPVPGEHEDRPIGTGRDDAGRLVQRQLLERQGHVGAAARGDPRHLGLVEDLAGADPVRPDPGGVDDVRGFDLDRGAGLGVAADDAPGPAVALEQRGHLEPIRHHRPESLGLAEDRQDEADVVGLAVVEQVGGLRIAIAQRRDQLEDLLTGDRPMPVRGPVREVEVVAVVLAAAAARHGARGGSRGCSP